MSSDKNKDEPFNPLLIYREQGYDSLKREQYEKAITAFDKAWRIDPECTRTLIGRSIAKSSCAQHSGAMYDAEMVLMQDDQHIMAFYQKAQALYEMGEFESGLVNFHRGLRRRRCPKIFEEGVMQAEETIEDCIGRNVGPVLMDMARTIRQMDEHTKKVAAGLDEPPMDEAAITKKQMKQDKLDRILGEKYLGRLAKDKIFLAELRFHPALQSPNKEGSRQLKRLADQAAQMLSERQDMLRMRMPYYAIKYREATVSETLRRRKEEEYLNKQLRAKEDSLKTLNKLREARTAGDIKVFLEIVDRSMEFFDNKTKKILPKKEEYMESLYNIVALTFLDQKQLKGTSKRQISHQIAFDLGLPDLMRTSKDQDIQPVRMPVIDTKKVIKSLEQRLTSSQNPKERAWVYYELARLHYDINKMDLSRLYSKKCINESKPVNNFAWCVNAGLLITKIEIGQRNKTDAKAALQDAMDSAVRLNEETTIKYIVAATAALDEADFDDIADNGIEVREKAIIKMISSDLALRGDMEYLFRRMSVMPANRRMSLMPGIKPTDRKKITIDAPPSPTDSLLPSDVAGRRKSTGTGGPAGEDAAAAAAAAAGSKPRRKSVVINASKTSHVSIGGAAAASHNKPPGKQLESAVSPMSAVIRRRSIGFAVLHEGDEDV